MCVCVAAVFVCVYMVLECETYLCLFQIRHGLMSAHSCVYVCVLVAAVCASVPKTRPLGFLRPRSSLTETKLLFPMTLQPFPKQALLHSAQRNNSFSQSTQRRRGRGERREGESPVTGQSYISPKSPLGNAFN